jgi:hypothetical protein
VNSFSALISESDGKIHGFIADAADWRLEELQDFCHWAASEKGIIGSHKRLRPTV